MSNITTRNQQAAGFRLALWGAGRLGSALAKVWFARTGDAPLVWSRGGQFPSGNAEKRIAEATWAADWADALKAQSVIIALPGRAFLDLAEGSEQAGTFDGNIFNAAASLSRQSLQRVFPRATIICIAPFLIDGGNSIPLLALRPTGLPDPEWEKAASELHQFGDVDVVRDDDSFAQISLLGAPWPVVVLAALHEAAGVGVQGLHDEAAVGLGRRLFFRAIQSLLSGQSTDRLEDVSSGETVATPGGITERGLKNIGEVTALLQSIFDKMQARANELRV